MYLQSSGHGLKHPLKNVGGKGSKLIVFGKKYNAMNPSIQLLCTAQLNHSKHVMDALIKSINKKLTRIQIDFQTTENNGSLTVITCSSLSLVSLWAS